MVERGCSVCGGAGNTCNCLVTGGYGVDVDGNGSIEAPYVVSLAADYLEKKIWCNAVGIPNGYSYVYLDGTQEFFTAEGISLGAVRPGLFFECKCECSSGGGGPGGPVELNSQFLYYNAFDEVSFIDDGTTSITGGLSGPDVQFVQNQVVAAPASMSSPFTGAATESQIRRTATGDIFTLPAFTRTVRQESSVFVGIGATLGATTFAYAETSVLSVTNNSATETMEVLLWMGAGILADYSMANSVLTGVNCGIQLSIDGAAYSGFACTDRHETIATAISGNILFRAYMIPSRWAMYSIAPSTTMTFKTRVHVTVSNSIYLYNVQNSLRLMGLVGRVS